MLWEHKPQASVSTAFFSSPKLSWACVLFLLENTAMKKGKLFNFDFENVSSISSRHHPSTACTSFVFLLSYRNTSTFNQHAYFLIDNLT